MDTNIVHFPAGEAEAQPFDFNGQSVRVVELDGEPWFVASDVAKILGYESSYYLTRGLDGDEKGAHIVGTPGGNQEMTIISESGLYSAILRSRVDGAKAFKRWITREVIPAIRKTGSYGAPKELTFEEMVERTLLESRARIQALESTVQELEPKANAWERFCSSTGDMSASEAAKTLARGGHDVGGLHKLYALCDKKRSEGGLGWFFRNGHEQREPYQSVIDRGLIRVKTSSIENSRTGEMFVSITPRFTAKALDAIAKHVTATQEAEATA
jgi:prophage antirepressor-like protein